jgi:molecular chaperone GrpE
MARIPVTDSHGETDARGAAQTASRANSGADAIPAESEVLEAEIIDDEEDVTAADGSAAAGAARGDGDVAAADAVMGETLSLADELAAAKTDANEMRDRFTRLQAEWDNYRKRTAANRIEERSRANEALITNLLPVVDDLARAAEHGAEATDVAAIHEGIVAVQKKFNDVLAKEGLTIVEPMGQAFDAETQQAVGKQEDPSIPEETVVQVYQKGYLLSGKSVRPAMVVVSTGGPRREPDKPAATSET